MNLLATPPPWGGVTGGIFSVLVLRGPSRTGFQLPNWSLAWKWCFIGLLLFSSIPLLCFLTSHPAWTGIFVLSLILEEAKPQHLPHTQSIPCFFTASGPPHFISIIYLFSFIALFKNNNCDLTLHSWIQAMAGILTVLTNVEWVKSSSISVVLLICSVTSLGISSFIFLLFTLSISFAITLAQVLPFCA